VSLPKETRFQECVGFSAALKEFKIRVQAVLLNQVEGLSPEQYANYIQEIERWPDEVQGPWRTWVELNHHKSEAHLFWKHRFTDRFSPLPVFTIERLKRSSNDLQDLKTLGETLGKQLTALKN
jgi:hypothetical protein